MCLHPAVTEYIKRSSNDMQKHTCTCHLLHLIQHCSTFVHSWPIVTPIPASTAVSSTLGNALETTVNSTALWNSWKSISCWKQTQWECFWVIIHKWCYIKALLRCITPQVHVHVQVHVQVHQMVGLLPCIMRPSALSSTTHITIHTAMCKMHNKCKGQQCWQNLNSLLRLKYKKK